MVWLLTFFTHSGAIACNRRAKAAGITARMLPVPRAVSSSCGTGMEITKEEPPLDLVDEDVDKLFRRTESGYVLVVDNDLE